jgi:hypothetical protein
MRIPTSAHTSLPWLIHEIAPDFVVEDVWALPAEGDADDFPALLDVFRSLEFPDSAPVPVRLLWTARDQLGRWCGLGRISARADHDGVGPLPIPGSDESSLLERLPDDLRRTAAAADTPGPPFRPLYRTGDEYAAQLSNRTVHAVLHLGWVERDSGRYRGQMAVLVKPRGRLGQAYMSVIKPFRYTIVYPALMKAIERGWRRQRRRDVGVTVAADQLTVTTIRALAREVRLSMTPR